MRTDKSFAYFLDFEFKLNGKCFLSKSESLGNELEVKDKDNMSRRLQIDDTAIGMETLGVQLAPDGSSKTHYNTKIIKVLTDKK